MTSFSGSADAATVASNAILDIDYGYSPVFNAHMNPTYGYLLGWSSTYGDVWHYVPGYGYSGYGDTLAYVEVFAPVTSGYKATYKETFSNAMYQMGMIW